MAFTHHMLEGFDVGGNSSPIFVDLDSDGDLDAFVGGENGTVRYYRNTGSAVQPDFVADATGNPLVGFNAGSFAVPVFADIDNDGDLDAFMGERNGTVKFYRNTGTISVPDFVADTASNPLAGFDVGLYAAPAFVDIDNDGDFDAFIGGQNGTLEFYRNTGTTSAPNFVTDVADNPLAGFDAGFTARPIFVDIDNDGDLDLFVGEFGGTARFYRNTGTVSLPSFVADAAGNPLAGIKVDSFAAPTLADIDHDGDLDAFVGERYGTVKFYRNGGTISAPNFTAEDTGNPLAEFNVGFTAAPIIVDIDNDGDLDAVVGERYGTVKFYRNTGTASVPIFTTDAAGNPLAGFDAGYEATLAFADIDDDGDLDTFIGRENGTVVFYRNTGTGSEPDFVADVTGNPLTGFDVGFAAAPFFADIDNDGDLDAFVGEFSGSVKFYLNTGTASSPNFIIDAARNPLAGFNVGTFATPAFADIDNDGDLDAFIGRENGTLAFYLNTGTVSTPSFVAEVTGNPLANFGVGSLARPAFADIDNDGDLDVFIGEGSGTVRFFQNATSNSPAAPSNSNFLIGLGSYPTNGGWFEVVDTTPQHFSQNWQRVNWDTYNSANGETRPVTCDIDGDGLKEIVIGLGTNSQGWLEIKDDASKGYAHLIWLNINWDSYSSINGETFPACGDVDGDGIDEIIVGLGTGGLGWLKGFDDAQTGYAALPGTPTNDGWIRLHWNSYNIANGETHPAMGQLDTDTAQELVIGLGNGGQGWVQILDDASSGFTPLAGTPVEEGWMQLNWNAYNTASGETRPAVCDLNNDGKGEIVLGLSAEGRGWLQIVDSGAGFTPLADTPTVNGWVRVNWSAYNAANGETFPDCGNVDVDAADELLIGLGQGGAGWVEIKDDANTNLTHQSWPRVHWSNYNIANGSTRPAVDN